MSGHPCDHCGDPLAPWGIAPPWRLEKGRRPLWVCGAPACLAWARAKRQAAIDAADPMARRRQEREAARKAGAPPAPHPAPPDPAQGRLF